MSESKLRFQRRDTDHAHAHAHAHPHAHPHPHAHVHGDAEASVGPTPVALPAGAAPAIDAPLARGAGRGKVLYFDAFSGAGGDMCVAALLDLGVPTQVVESALSALALSGVRYEVQRVFAGAIAARHFDVRVAPGSQPQRSYAQIVELLQQAPLATGVRALALRIFERLAQAEARVHGVEVPAVHFHEVGAADSLVDIVAAAACLEHLDARVLCSALPLGRGFTHSQHGVIPIPAPATVLCAQGLVTFEGDIEAELLTPTAAAVLGVVARSARWPELLVERVGWGAGSRVLVDRPNALRVVLGSPAPGNEQVLHQLQPSEAATHELIETNLDDATGELLAHVLEQLLVHGALDAWVTPILMKKGRPGHTVSALSTPERSALLAEIMLRESSSIGVRISAARRITLQREIGCVHTPYGPVAAKFSGPVGPLRHVKPEFDACKALAHQCGVPVRLVWEAALAACVNQHVER